MNENVPSGMGAHDCARNGRRKFLIRLSIALSSIGAALVAVPSFAFLLGLRKTPQIWRTVGKIDDFKIGSTVNVSFQDSSPLPWAGVTAQTAAWLRRVSDQQFIAFSMNCTHLGCPVRWLADADLFMCPCHGGAYYQDGSRASGPPERGLFEYSYRVVSGKLLIKAGEMPTPGQASNIVREIQPCV